MSELLRRFTPARVDLGRAGDAVPTRGLLDFQLAHARARDAVHTRLDVYSLLSLDPICVRSAAHDRTTYLKRPDLGRKLSGESKPLLTPGPYDVAFVVADGLSALAVQRHSIPVLQAMQPLLEGLRIAPIIVAEQARVALGDEIGALLQARILVMLIGERPGMSAPDSMGAYITYEPRPGRKDAERNCISNIRTEGLSYSAAAHRLALYIRAALDRQLTGVQLRINTDQALPAAESSSAGESTAIGPDTHE